MAWLSYFHRFIIPDKHNYAEADFYTFYSSLSQCKSAG